MKKFLLLLCTLLGTAGTWATVVPELTLTTDANNPTYYVIKSYRSGNYAKYVDASTQLAQEESPSINSLWYFMANGDGVSIIPAANPSVKMESNESATTDGAVYYVAENKNNAGSYCISLNSNQSANCWDANGMNPIGTWQPSATDYAGTSWIITETVVTKADVDGGNIASALTNSAFAFEKAEAIARICHLSKLAIFSDANLAAVKNATNATALNAALAAFNTDVVMCCRSGKFLNVGESGGSFETSPSIIQLISAGGGAFYLKGKDSGKYMGNVETSTAIGTDDTPTTAFFIQNYGNYSVARPTAKAEGGYQYIHNGGSGCVGWVPSGENTQFMISEPFITDISELSSNKAYYITTFDRGAWFVPAGGSAVTSTYKAGIAPLSRDTKQQFAFLTYGSTGIYHLYSISEKKFVSKSENYTTLTSELGDNVTLLTGTGNASYPFVVALQDGAYQMGISNGYDPAVITFWNSLADGGNQVQIREVADFNPTEAMAILEAAYSTTVTVTYEVYDGETLVESQKVVQDKNSAVAIPAALLKNTWYYDYAASGTIGQTDCTITVNRTYKSGVVASLSGLSNNKAYTLETARGTFTTDNGELANTSKSESSYTVYNFAIVKYASYYYLWSVQDGKFVAGDGTALTDTPTAITINELEEPLFKIQCGSNYLNCNTSNGGFFSGWSTTDDGNRVAIIEAADFDPAPVISAIEKINYYEMVEAEVLPFLMDSEGNPSPSIGKLFGLSSEAAINISQTYANQFENKKFTLAEAEAVVAAKDAGILYPEAGKFYLVKNNYNGKYLHVTGNGARGTVFADLTAEEASKDISAHICFTADDSDSKLYMRSQGKYFNWVYSHEDNKAYLSDNKDKYVHFAAPAPGVGAFSIAYGNGVGNFADYLNSGFYALWDESTMDVGGSSNGAASEMAQWTFKEVSTLDIALNTSIDGSYYTTFCAPFDMTLNGATAYTVAKGEGTQLTTTEVSGTIAAGTPVLLVATSNSATATIGSNYSTAISTETALTGSYLEIAEFDGATNYILGSDSDGKAGFVHSEGTTLSANCAYIAGDESTSSIEAFHFTLDPSESIVGDVNDDGKITIADVTALVNIILGKATIPASGVADVNGDTKVTIADVTALVNIILGKKN